MLTGTAFADIFNRIWKKKYIYKTNKYLNIYNFVIFIWKFDSVYI
jgi:hypothetical protein